MIGLALLLALATPQSASALPYSSLSERDHERARAALSLTRVLFSEQLLRLQTERVLVATIPGALTASPDVQLLEKGHPGITDRIINIARSRIVPAIIADLPKLQEATAAIYSRNYSQVELVRMEAFYRSDAGKRMQESYITNLDLGSFAAEAMASGGEVNLSPEQSAAIRSAATDKVIDTMSDADLLAFADLTESLGIERFDRVEEEVNAARQQWISDPNSQLNTTIQQIIIELVAEYEADGPTKTIGAEQ